MPDFIPPTDNKFDEWQQQFLAYVTANQAALDVTPAQAAALTGQSADWNAAFEALQAARSAFDAAVILKREKRAALTADIRALAARLRASPAVTDVQRIGLGLGAGRGPHAAPPVPAPTTAPRLRVDMGTRLVHVIAFWDEHAHASRAKPAGVMGCELWQKIGGEATGANEGMTYLAIGTRSPLRVELGGGAIGQQAFYVGRWVSTRGEHGPWSAVVGATVGG